MLFYLRTACKSAHSSSDDSLLYSDRPVVSMGKLAAVRLQQPSAIFLVIILYLANSVATQPRTISKLVMLPATSGNNNNNNNRPASNQTSQHQQRKPSSSSSIFADIEDLNDSSVRSRYGIQQPKQAQPEFEHLIERLISVANSRQVNARERGQPEQQVPSGLVPADANNRTTMRFFRNNKTFASIVYTNQDNRLINCHLVDLERHSSDVALFEIKYDILTIDIDFLDMMQLIEACTNIARLKRPLLAINRPGQQQQQQQQPQPQSKPLFVLGRPVPAAAPPSTSVAGFQSLMSGALNQELKSLGPSALQDDSPKLDLPPTTTTTTAGTQRRQRRRLLAHSAPESGQFNAPSTSLLSTSSMPPPTTKGHAIVRDLERQHTHARPVVLLSQAIAKVGETSKKLVLGEVTPAPNTLEQMRNSGIKEALQEITSYDSTDLLAIWRGILPGTNWCGMGDRATSYNDLGFESDIDICCRAHDFCPIRLSAFSAGYGLFNWSFYTRSHCSCDQNFLNCLQRAQSPLSAVVMKFYFTIMKTTCLHDNETSSDWQLQQQHQQHQQQTQQLLQGGNGARGGQAPAQPLVQVEATAQQQRLLFDQIRASLPIPALKQSQVMQARVEKQHGQQQQRRPTGMMQQQ